MWRTSWLGAVLLFSSSAGVAPARPLLRSPERAARALAGTLVAYTKHHGGDRRIWSAVLGEWRDLYVYLPPGYDPHRQYPVLLWLHGIAQDERAFVDNGLLAFDAAIACGRLPPTIIAMPDGSYKGRPGLLGPQTLWLNSDVGLYEDYLVRDVWAFVQAHYPVVPVRQGHVIGGYSGGAAAAYRVAIKYRAEFGVVFGLSGPLNARWMDCRGRYFANFDPCCWGWRTDFSRGRAPVGRFAGGAVVVRLRSFVYPLFGRGPESLPQIIANNPIEMLDEYGVRPGALAMFVAYGGRDEFNIDAQVESFVYRARQLGLEVTAVCDRRGRHRLREAEKFLPRLIDWLAPLVMPYSPY